VVRKMTSLPADRFGLSGRGRVAGGSFADLVLIDPGAVRDTSTFERPHAFAEGLTTVIVNGSVSWDRRSPDTIARHGRALRRTGPG